ncbi:MAG: CDP-alcohol phosphatidyltransferase family protein [Coriobacteriia bacterium]|nr:CDP-alcohol phosphatidyltransferase family protein [Coriobacteriia bacterium]
MNEKNYKINPEFTLPNVITVIRLIMVPVAFFLLVDKGNNKAAFFVFALAGVSDFIDGQIARRTDTVSEFGKLLDPFVDRFLILAGVVGLFVVGRIPLWVVSILVLRDAYLAIGLSRVKHRGGPQIEVIFTGKLTTALLFTGFTGLILDWPRTAGLGVTSANWLPGFNGAVYVVWIWLVYAGVVLSLITAARYTSIGYADFFGTVGDKKV